MAPLEMLLIPVCHSHKGLSSWFLVVCSNFAPYGVVLELRCHSAKTFRPISNRELTLKSNFKGKNGK